MVKGFKWCVFTRWESSKQFWRMDFTEQPSELLRAMMRGCYDRLFVIKAQEINARHQQGIEERFENCHKGDGWYIAHPSLRKFLEEEMECQTIKAKHLFDIGHPRIVWAPVRTDAKERLRKAVLEVDLPPYVKNARRFVLWAIEDIELSERECASRMIIEHPSNVVYSPRTIYNTVNCLVREGKVLKSSGRLLTLSDDGTEELEGARTIWELKQKKNPRSLRV